jgi:hypothetical protein
MLSGYVWVLFTVQNYSEHLTQHNCNETMSCIEVKPWLVVESVWLLHFLLFNFHNLKILLIQPSQKHSECLTVLGAVSIKCVST